MRHTRTAIAALALSAAGLVAIINDEHYTSTAVVPTKNDRPTVGFGSTFKEDGSPVQMGDTIEPVQAVKRSLGHIQKDESKLKRCVTGPMYQAEYDVLVDFSYQYGTQATCNSSVVRHINTGRYSDSCNAYTLYKYSGGYDCSTLINGKPNKRCWGVWTRNLERKARCLEAANE
jgi:GH24 family phage-related lysozyme (muramidase)